VQLSPTEARQLAGMLTRKADETGGTHTAPSMEAKTYFEDGQKSIVFDLPGVGPVALALPDDGLRFLAAEVSKLLEPPH
jgi:hypothetical protein